MLKLKLPILISLIIILNILIYYRAFMIEPAERVFAECARNSGRTAAAINLILLLMLGHYGLQTIFHEKLKKNIFQILITLFAINHLIHFFFVFQNFNIQAMELNVNDNLHGFITFISLIIMPFVVLFFKRLSVPLYAFIIAHFFNVTYFISISFYARYKPEDPAYLHRIGVAVMILALLYVLYRSIIEMRSKFKKDSSVELSES